VSPDSATKIHENTKNRETVFLSSLLSLTHSIFSSHQQCEVRILHPPICKGLYVTGQGAELEDRHRWNQGLGAHGKQGQGLEGGRLQISSGIKPLLFA
jgi:hypothetical protein